MSFQLPTQRRRTSGQPAWSGAAFLVEAMVLLVFLVASLAVFTQMFALAAQRGAESRVVSQAVAAAGNVAERFAADPANAAGEFTVEGQRVVCDVQVELREGGSLYHAVISVYDDSEKSGDPVYTVQTASYESEAR